MKTIRTIEFGGGNNPSYRPNVDIRKLDNVDVVIDLNDKKYPIPTEEYDFVYSRYLLEHISWCNIKNFLKEIYRILKPGGRIEITTSNLLEQAKVIVNTSPEKWDDNLLGLIFGAEDYPENTHRCGFSPQSITNVLTSFGFYNIEITPINSNFGPTDMFIKAIKHGTISDKNIKTITGVDRQNWVIQHCELGKKILDIGSQDGHTFRDTPLAPFVTSVDLDTYDFPGFVQMDAHNLKFEDKSFDIAILGEILEHCDDPVQVLKEANRVSKRLLITVPDEWNWDKSLFPFETIEDGMKRRNLSLEEIVRVSNPQAKEFYIEDNHKHLFHNRYYTQQTLTQDLEKAGITDYEMTLLQYGYPRWSFFVVDTMPHNTVPTKSTIKDPIISTGPIITEGPILDTKHPLSRNIPLRIALISTPFFTVPPSKYGGLERIVWDLAEALDELGHQIVIFGPEGSKATKHGKLIVTGHSISTTNVDWFQAEKDAYEKYKDVITPERFDIIIDHSWFAFIYLSKMNNSNIKVMHVHHGGYGWDSLPPIVKPNLVAISDFMKQYTINYFAQKVGCERVHNGIDLTKYIFDPNIKKTNRLLYVGRFSKFKGVNTAIELAKKVNLSIDLVGSSFVDSHNYMKQIESMCDGNKVVIHKDMSQEYKIEMMQKAKAIIIPSQMNEPLNLVSLEGQACGTAVIVTRDGGLPETVIQEKTGFICDNISDMIAAAKDIDKIKPEDCRKHVEDNFSRLKMAKNYEKLCRRILHDEEW